MTIVDNSGNQTIFGKYLIIGVVSYEGMNRYVLTRGGQELTARIPQEVLDLTISRRTEDMKPEQYVLEIIRNGQFIVPLIRSPKAGEIEEIKNLPPDIPVMRDAVGTGDNTYQ